MPKDVSDWIEGASARITYLTSTVERLKQENKNLRASHKLMEQRVMGYSQE
jgi:predicted RNase H-like nuclease (RuvC/YqgF family)